MNWISVDENLPGKAGFKDRFLVVVQWIHNSDISWIATAKYFGNGEFGIDSPKNMDCTGHEVIYWTKLPDLPK